VKGLHLHQNKTWIYVSPGTGYWGPPIRLGNEPEITVFKLTWNLSFHGNPLLKRG